MISIFARCFIERRVAACENRLFIIFSILAPNSFSFFSTAPGLYGLIPLMASASFGQIGALNAESFCERVLRCAGHVLTEGNTLLSDEELEMLVILRMNRTFMEFMRTHYNELTKDHFQRTVVDEEPSDGESDDA